MTERALTARLGLCDSTTSACRKGLLALLGSGSAARFKPQFTSEHPRHRDGVLRPGRVLRPSGVHKVHATVASLAGFPGRRLPLTATEAAATPATFPNWRIWAGTRRKRRLSTDPSCYHETLAPAIEPSLGSRPVDQFQFPVIFV